MLEKLKNLLLTLRCWIVAASPLADLALRLWVANVFWKSGLTKIASWDSTVALFENEYAVPLLPPEIAAYMGTATELSMPVLLVLGLGTRFGAFVLFVFNIIAVVSYPDLSEAGRYNHVQWGLMILIIFAHGPGKLSLDYWLSCRFLRVE
ncbi:MAG TPA: DoxX family protein [Methylophilaceae bacterium]|nr:DoxX family protein [Methylophilaceae bacterium]HQR60913.1 DoxX family protein [Methylophilaceae bacterium]